MTPIPCPCKNPSTAAHVRLGGAIYKYNCGWLAEEFETSVTSTRVVVSGYPIHLRAQLITGRHRTGINASTFDTRLPCVTCGLG